MKTYGGGRHSCEGKLRFDTEEEARIAAKKTRKNIGARIRPYLCVRCGFYHNGHNRMKRYLAGKYKRPDNEGTIRGVKLRP